MRVLLGYERAVWSPKLKQRIKSVPGVRLVDLRLTSRWVEIDVIAEREGLDKLLEALGEPAWTREIKIGELPRNPVERALSYYREDRVWEAYEILEELWRRERSGHEKSCLQAILLGLAAIVHRQRGRRNEQLEKRALEKLGWAEESCSGLPYSEVKARLLE